jgi:hypothetical protein
MRTRSLRLSCAAAIAAVMGFSAGCSNLQMPVPAELAAVSEELPVADRSRFAGLPGVDQSFRIGSYEITDVDWDSQFTVSGTIQNFSHKDIKGGYSYLFRGSYEERRGECAIEAHEKGIALGGPLSLSKDSGTLGCRCLGSESESTLTVRLSHKMGRGPRDEGQWVLGGGATAGPDERDELWAGGRRFAISIISSTEMKGKTWVVGEGTRDTVQAPFMEPTGCLVYGAGPEGGLELLHPGRVWLARSLDSTEREDMACLFGGLLLYDSP